MAAEIRTFIRTYFLQSTTSPVTVNLFVCFLCVCFRQGIAQVCTDPSGPLVVNQTFGVSTKPLSLEATAYPYEAKDCPGDGQYTITSRIDGTCFNSTWHAVVSDHTPNEAGGSMLIVNGGNKAGPFYQQPVPGLCSGTTYEVSFWVINLLRTNTCLNALIPDLSIDVVSRTGIVIQSTALGLIVQTDEPIWKKYAAVFTMPADTEEVIIKLINNQGDYGCGNDLVIDDFQLKQCSACAGVPETVYIPDVFTPNNDGVNDTLDVFLLASGITSFSLKVYNRWGSLIYASTDMNQQWDGTYAGLPSMSDAYTWVLNYGINGQTTHTQTGRVLLLR